MKTKVIIENGETTIHLTHENDFEKSIIETASNYNTPSELETSIHCDYGF